MRRFNHYSLLAVIVIVLLTMGASSTSEMTWTVKTGDDILEGEGTTFNLAELADGETRTFGPAEKQFTVSRKGNIVTMTHAGSEDSAKLETICNLDKDSCKIITFDGESGKTAIVVEKSGGCCEGDRDCIDLATTLDLDQADGHVTVMKKFISGVEHGCQKMKDVLISGDDETRAFAFVTHDGTALEHMENLMVIGQDGHTIVIPAGDEIMLRCPEGDTTMTVSKDEADEVFLCPRHSVPMEKTAGAKQVHKIMIRMDEDE